MRTAAVGGFCPHSAPGAELPLPSREGGPLEAEYCHLLALLLLADRDGQGIRPGLRPGYVLRLFFAFYTRNLVVAATGTGKTVISTLDYKRFCKHHPGKPCRLLFVAHREEILRQSLYTFRAVLKDANFGELFVGS